MSRRDTIIIAVLINTGMLAILFMMAIHTENDLLTDSFDITHHVVEEQSSKTSRPEESVEPIALAQTSSRDELDHVLMDYATPTPQSATSKPKPKPKPAPTPAVNTVVQPPPFRQAAPSQRTVTTSSAEKQHVEVTVKRGDCLGKIALANNTTVREIKETNGLTTERIDIGQVLLVPVNTRARGARRPPQPETLTKNGVEYYTVQRGDNPWKIAKQFHVKFEDLLTLNELDEEKARNLKVGDRIRVK